MLSREVVVTLPGTPAAKGSMRCVGRNGAHRLIPDNSLAQKRWRAAIVDAVRRYDGDRADKWQPIGVEVTFTLPRRDGQYDDDGKLKPRAHEFPTMRGTLDVDKLARLVLDALQDAQIILDDAQIVDMQARKSYALDEPVSDKPPDWIEHNTAPDALSYSGARIRIYPIEW